MSLEVELDCDGLLSKHDDEMLIDTEDTNSNSLILRNAENFSHEDYKDLSEDGHDDDDNDDGDEFEDRHNRHRKSINDNHAAYRICQ